MATSQRLSIRRLVLLGALRLSMVWDLVATCIGILIILDTVHPIAYSIAFIGTLIVVAFNFSTQVIWTRVRGQRTMAVQRILLKIVWALAMLVDLWTSLTCNAWFISPHPPAGATALGELLATLNFGQLIIVVFVTAATAISPMLVGYFRDLDVDFLR